MPKQITLVLPKPHEAQQRILREKKRFNVICCGRRFGKTLLCINLLVEPALQGYPVAWFAPSYKYLIEVWRETVRILKPIIAEKNSTDKRIQLLTGGVIDFWSLEDPDAGRSRKYKRAVVDEAAKVRYLETAWTESIRATLADYVGDVFFPSTPKGLNYFHTLYQKGTDEFQTDWQSWQMPTSSNPFIKPEEIEAARESLPEQVFKQEFLAEFIVGEGAVFRNIQANLTEEKTEFFDHHSHSSEVVAGVDWGQVNDFTVISIGCRMCKREIYLERFNKIDWNFQRQRLQTAMEKYKVSYALIEENSIGSPNIEEMIRLGLPVQGFQMTAQSKPELIQSLALSFEKEEMKFIKDDLATRELEAYEAVKNEHTGRIAYNAPSGFHDDTVIARALMRKAMLENSSWEAD